MNLQDAPTIFIDIREPEPDPLARLAEIFINALSLTGFFAVLAIVVGILVAILMVRRRARLKDLHKSSGDFLKP